MEFIILKNNVNLSNQYKERGSHVSTES